MEKRYKHERTIMIKQGFVLCCILLLNYSSSAQNAQKAKELLEEVAAKVKSYDNMVIKFNYTLEDDARNIRQKTKGTVQSKGDKYKIELLGTTRIFDGNKLYEIIPEDEEINISRYDPDGDNEFSPSKMFYFYQDGYSFEWDIEQNNEGRKIQYIKLKPDDHTSGVQEILLGIDTQTKHIYKIIQIMDDQNKMVVDVTSFKVNQPLSKNLFKFNEEKYQGYYINRLD